MSLAWACAVALSVAAQPPADPYGGRVFRVEGRARSVAFSPDGKVLAVGGEHLGLFDAETGRLLHRLPVSQCVQQTQFSPDGRFLVSAGGDKGLPAEVALWDPATGELVRKLKGPDLYGVCVAFSPDGKRVVAGCSGPPHAFVWDAASGKLLGRFTGHAGAVAAVAFSPDGKLVASAGCETMVRIWDPETFAEVRVPVENPRLVWSLAFTPDGGTLVTSSADGEVRHWDVASHTQIGKYSRTGKVTLNSCVSPDGRFVATTYQAGEGMVMIREAGWGRWHARLKPGGENFLSVAFSPDSRQIAVGGWDGVVRIWSVDAITRVNVQVPAAER